MFSRVDVDIVVGNLEFFRERVDPTRVSTGDDRHLHFLVFQRAQLTVDGLHLVSAQETVEVSH